MDDQPRLYTLNETSEITGLSADALRQRIKRHRLRGIRGNDGLVRIRLSTAEIEALASSRLTSRLDADVTSQLAIENSAIKALHGEANAHRELVQILRDQLERAGPTGAGVGRRGYRADGPGRSPRAVGRAAGPLGRRDDGRAPGPCRGRGCTPAGGGEEPGGRGRGSSGSGPTSGATGKGMAGPAAAAGRNSTRLTVNSPARVQAVRV